MKEDDIVLTTELKKLKEQLEQTGDNKKLLEELNVLDNAELQAIYESLSTSSVICPTCGKPL